MLLVLPSFAQCGRLRLQRYRSSNITQLHGKSFLGRKVQKDVFNSRNNNFRVTMQALFGAVCKASYANYDPSQQDICQFLVVIFSPRN